MAMPHRWSPVIERLSDQRETMPTTVRIAGPETR
jgi:hypothetical protein